MYLPLELIQTALVMFRVNAVYKAITVVAMYLCHPPKHELKHLKGRLLYEKQAVRPIKDSQLMELNPFFTLKLAQEYTCDVTNVCHGYTAQLCAKALEFVCAVFVNCFSDNHNCPVLAKQQHIARLTSLRVRCVCVLLVRCNDVRV